MQQSIAMKEGEDVERERTIARGKRCVKGSTGIDRNEATGNSKILGERRLDSSLLCLNEEGGCEASAEGPHQTKAVLMYESSSTLHSGSSRPVSLSDVHDVLYSPNIHTQREHAPCWNIGMGRPQQTTERGRPASRTLTISYAFFLSESDTPILIVLTPLRSPTPGRAATHSPTHDVLIALLILSAIVIPSSSVRTCPILQFICSWPVGTVVVFTPPALTTASHSPLPPSLSSRRSYE